MDSSQPIREEHTIDPFKVEQALVGMELGSSDGPVLAYLNFLSQIIPINQMHFLHFLEPLRLFESLYKEGYLELLQHEAMTEATQEKMEESVRAAFENRIAGQYIVDAKMGNALEELVDATKQLKADLVVVGQKTGTNQHSVLARKFVRKVRSNALLIPDTVKPELNRILVPMDYSPLSIKAIQTAVAINQQLETPVPITCVNVFEVPPVNWYRIQRSEKQMKTMLEADRSYAFDALKAKYFPIHKGNIHFQIIEKERPGIGSYIMDFATNNDYDLIIMGAKGHSNFEQMILGSVTEKVVALSKSIPVLIVR